jgi:hypothetical protein
MKNESAADIDAVIKEFRDGERAIVKRIHALEELVTWLAEKNGAPRDAIRRWREAAANAGMPDAKPVELAQRIVREAK